MDPIESIICANDCSNHNLSDCGLIDPRDLVTGYCESGSTLTKRKLLPVSRQEQGEVTRKALAGLSVLAELIQYGLPVLLQHLLLGSHKCGRIGWIRHLCRNFCGGFVRGRQTFLLASACSYQCLDRVFRRGP